MLNVLIPHPESFFSKYWEEKALKWVINPSLNIDFNLSDFWDLIESGQVEYPQIECLNYEGVTDTDEYLASLSKISPKKIRSLSEMGHTIRIRNVDEFNSSLKALKLQLCRTFKSHISLNVYFSKSSKGTKAHYDVHHVFGVQLAGKKTWKLGEKVEKVPRYDFTPIRIQNGFEVQETFSLHAGQMLYVPVGLIHQTETNDFSLHLAIGVLPDDWTNHIQSLLQHTMKRHAILRKSLPFFVEDNQIVQRKPRQEEIEKLLSLLLLEADAFSDD